MQLMVEGDVWELYIPSELAYGDDGFGEHIVAGDMLHFDLELVKIDGPARPAAQRAADDHTEVYACLPCCSPCCRRAANLSNRKRRSAWRRSGERD